MTDKTYHRFYPQSVLSILDGAGHYDEGLDAHVSVEIHGDHAEVELTPVENGEVLIGTERFRVTVERIEPATECECNGGDPCECPDCDHADCSHRCKTHGCRECGGEHDWPSAQPARSDTTKEH